MVGDFSVDPFELGPTDDGKPPPVATRNSWQIHPMPETRVALPLEVTYDAPSWRIVQLGFIPRAMEDKWFAFEEEGVLHMHRSWSGLEVYELHFEEVNGAWQCTTAWVNADPDEYRPRPPVEEVEHCRRLLDFLVAVGASRGAGENMDNIPLHDLLIAPQRKHSPSPLDTASEEE